MALRVVCGRVGDARMVVRVVMSYSAHWRWPPGSEGWEGGLVGVGVGVDVDVDVDVDVGVTYM